MTNARLDLTAIRERLAAERGPDYWRGLDELAQTEEFREFLQAEFPSEAPALIDPVSRRRFLQLMGASVALAGFGACTKQPQETIVPYDRQPEAVIPGRPLFFATAYPLAGVGTGILVESHLGRPTKIEGNPDHPASLGATDLHTQASILDLYDPDRAQVVTNLGQIRPWAALVETLRLAVDAQSAKRGAGLRVLTGSVTSPTLVAQLRRLLDGYPAAKWHQWEPAGCDGARAGAKLAFGEYVSTRYAIAEADVILSLESDFLACGAGSVRYAREFAGRRRPGDGEMNRLYVVEGVPSNTGAVSDHRLRVRPSQVEAVARAVAKGVGVEVSAGDAVPGVPDGWIDAVVRDLVKHRGASAVIPGEYQPAVVHALAHAINHALGNVGRTVIHTDPIEPVPVDHAASIRELASDLDRGAVDLLVILGGNPVYTAPADLEFAERLEKAAMRVYLGLYADETAALCHWHVPETHPLESWSDLVAFDGTASVVQPLIAPLYEGRSAHELLGALLGDQTSAYDLVRATWKARASGDFESAWRRALHDGVVAAALPARTVTLRPPSTWPTPTKAEAGALELVFRPDPTIHDGRFANNGWLQELPKPTTKLTWDNAALVSPKTADRLGVSNEEVVDLAVGGRSVRAPVWIQPGHADDAVTVTLGYGRTRAGRVGNGRGFDAYRLRTSEAPWFRGGVEMRKTGDRLRLACTQLHQATEGRPILLSASLEEYRTDPEFARKEAPDPPEDLTVYPGYRYEGYAWGMAIDLSTCVGCSACVVACQAENNIAVVGKDQVVRGREMHWLRVDRYHKGGIDDPETFFQPVPCMQCENAPCELVCPVGATVHSHEGLNDMVYNRCVGTRYCSNNCPYKVRRFNFYLYSDWATDSLKSLRNPDVSVRSRGVMEKCTYCVQRINEAKIDAEKEDRRVRDGEIKTACQQACPADAIVFGDINDRASRVAKLKSDARNYSLLAELNTRPRTTYLAAVRNPNPELEA